MKSNQKSVGKKFLKMLILCLVASLALVQCTIVQPRQDQKRESTSGSKLSTSGAEGIGNSTVTGELSLKEDIETIEELRKHIPEMKRRENDALKIELSLLGEVKLSPQTHRERFNRIMRTMRKKRRRQARKVRDNFNKEERKSREKFLTTLKKEREAFNKKKVTRDVRKDFYDQQDQLRREYFAEERDKRREFQSEMRQQDSDFQAMYRERNDEFNKELRIYTQRYNEVEKQRRATPVTGTPTHFEKLGAGEQ